MNSHDLAVLVPWLISHGYLIFLVAATIEGPITTIAAGVVTALGFFNLYIIIALAILADIGGDLIYYFIGYSSHNLIRSKFFRFFGLTDERIKKTQEILKTKTFHAVLIAKMSPLTGPIGSVAIGAFRPQFKKFFWPAFGISIVKSTFFIFVGYYSSQAYVELNKIIAKSEYTISLVLGGLVLVYLLYLLITKKILKRF